MGLSQSDKKPVCISCEDLHDDDLLAFLKFMHVFIKQLGCSMESVNESSYIVKKSGQDTGVSLEFVNISLVLASDMERPANVKAVVGRVQLKKRAARPFNDVRYFQYAEHKKDMPKVLASFDNPQQMNVLLELICKGVYFNTANLRTWRCADCKTKGKEIFLQDGSMTTIDNKGNEFYLIINENENEQGVIFDELINQYVLAICHKCYQNRSSTSMK